MPELLVRVKFIQVWGYPTKNIVCGPGRIVDTTRWIADRLINGGYAVELKEASDEVPDSI